MAGTKNRIKADAQACRDYLRAKHPLAEDFIRDLQAPVKRDQWDAVWQQFTDQRQIQSEMLERVETAFQRWFNGD